MPLEARKVVFELWELLDNLASTNTPYLNCVLLSIKGA
jgi:hypothetical protein